MLIGCSFVQIVFFFIFYCFCGWIIESTYVSVCTKKLTNRGFMRGPVIPIYGCGAMMLLFAASPFLQYPVLVFFAGMVGCSILEYFTGAAMEAIFKVRYWDYSNKPFNLNGHICLFTSICWGFCALGANYFLHKPVDHLIRQIPEGVLKGITIALSIIFIIDLTLSFKAAYDLRTLLIKIDKAKDEMRLMAKRLDVMIAYASESLEERKDMVGDRIDNWSSGIEDRMERVSDSFDNKIDALTDAIEDRFKRMKAVIDDRPQIFPESLKEEFYELRAKFSLGKESRLAAKLTVFKDFFVRGMIHGNPTLVSKQYQDSLDKIKEINNSNK